MSSVIDNNQQDQRAFPRITVSCPVLFRLPSEKRWKVAKLLNFSATGLSMICDIKLGTGTKIILQIKPGSQKTVPAISAIGTVVRCETNEEQKYVVSYKLTKVQR